MYVKLLITSVVILFLSVYIYNCDYCIDYIARLFASKKDRLFSKEELKQYNGKESSELYLSILGIVYNVTRSHHLYGPDKAYNFFVGKDASASFVSGKFDEESISDHVADMDLKELKSIQHWVKFYEKEYKAIGKLIGTYYDEYGKPTSYNIKVMELLKKAEEKEQEDNLQKSRFPPCNVEWDAKDQRTRVWCTRRSGGIERDWVGVPRQLYEAGSKSFRCACVNEENYNLGNVREYVGCEPTSSSCYVVT